MSNRETRNNNHARHESNRDEKNDGRVKHSGAKNVSKADKDGVIIFEGISAWNYSKDKGMVTVFITPYNKSKDLVKSQSGKVYMKMIAKIMYTRTGNVLIRPVLCNVNTDRVVISDLGWVVNPNAKNGGYCGSFTKKD